MHEQIVSGRVVSSTPGRLRIRIRHAPQRSQSVGRAREHLERQPGVHQVDSNSITGSVLIQYDHRVHTVDGLLQTLRDVGVVVEEVAGGLGLEVPEVGGHSTTAGTVVGALDRLDRRLSAMTGRTVDLKLLVPLTLGGVGVWQTLTRGLGINQVPGYVLLWYAFDSFWKFHHEPIRETRRDGWEESVQPSSTER